MDRERIRRSLSSQDREILRLLVECANDEMIARRMAVSVRTVRRRIARILSVLGVENRFAAGVASATLGLIAYPSAMELGYARRGATTSR